MQISQTLITLDIDSWLKESVNGKVEVWLINL